MHNLVTFASLGIVAVILIETQSTLPIAAQATKNTSRWEYATMHRDGMQIRLRLPDKTIEARNYLDVCKQSGKLDAEDTEVASLNSMGDDGWDLVQERHETSAEGGRLSRWTFKRSK